MCDVSVSYRSHSLIELTGAKYSWGGPTLCPLLAVDALDMVVTYDILNRVLICMEPFAAPGLFVQQIPLVCTQCTSLKGTLYC